MREVMPEKLYRVWVEKHECGWVNVNAPDEEIARDRAQKVADLDWWDPESSHSTPLTVELRQADAAVDPGLANQAEPPTRD